MATLVEMATEMVITRAKSTPLSAEEMISELKRFHSELKRLESGETSEEEKVETQSAAPGAPAITVKEAFRKNEVVCMICGKGGFKTLTRHLTTAHGIKPGEYRKQFGIPAKQSLSAKSTTEARRKLAQDRGLAANLAKAREVRMAKLAGQKPAAVPAAAAPKAKTAKSRKAPVKAAE